MSDQWTNLAKQLGYESEGKMWEALYPKFSVMQLSVKFSVGVNTIRTHIAQSGITLRKRGGANNVKFAVNEELINKIIAQGVPKTAGEIGVSQQALYRRVYYRFGLKVKDLKDKAAALHKEGITLPAEASQPVDEPPAISPVQEILVHPHEQK